MEYDGLKNKEADKTETKKELKTESERKPEMPVEEGRETVKFGRYPQGKNGEIEDIEWLVL